MIRKYFVLIMIVSLCLTELRAMNLGPGARDRGSMIMTFPHGLVPSGNGQPNHPRTFNPRVLINDADSCVPGNGQQIRNQSDQQQVAAPHYLTSFEERLRQPEASQNLAEALTLAEQYNLEINGLKSYYNLLQHLAKWIVETLHVRQKVELHSKITDAINPGTAQLEPGCVVLEFRNRMPSGFWSTLGYFPICECAAVYDEAVLTQVLSVITNFLGLKKVKDLDSGASLWRCPVGERNPVARGQSPMPQERRQAIPYQHAELIWRAVKPEDRATYWG